MNQFLADTFWFFLAGILIVMYSKTQEDYCQIQKYISGKIRL